LVKPSPNGRYLRANVTPGAVVTQSKAIDQASTRSGCSGDFRGTVNYDRSGVSQRLAHHRLPPALIDHGRRRTYKELADWSNRLAEALIED
jgi:hypothetical protein